MRQFLFGLSVLVAGLCFMVRAAAEPPKTAAEASGYERTSTFAEVTAFCEELAKQSSRVRLSTLGTSQEGRKLPLVIVADPPVATAAEAEASKKLVVFAMGNIHAGEVDGKEGLLMLARDLALGQDKSLLEHLMIVIAPIFNADGNEKFGNHRPEQAGPPSVGTRENAAGLDLNRDFVKLESPEVRALVKLLNTWNPAVVIDCHTTNGSHHRYTLTYEGGRCPAGDPRLIEFTQGKLLPAATKLLKEKTGFESYFYGNFAGDHTRWETVLPQPRFGTHYVGLRGRVAVLSESYSYASFKDRVLASQEFVRAVLRQSADERTEIRRLIALTPPERVALRYKAAPQGKPIPILGFVEEEKEGRRVATTTPRDYEAQYLGGTETTLAVTRPYAYLLTSPSPKVIENLQRHGLTVEELREDLDLEVEAYKVDRITRGRLFQRHDVIDLEASVRKETRRVKAGTALVKTAQPLGNLAVNLLEPQSSDGLVTWNFFDEQLKEGGDFPVLRLPAAATILTARVPALAEERKLDKPITYEAVYGGGFGRGLSFSGSPAIGQTWLPSGEHYLQQRDGQLSKVEARTGKLTPYYDPAPLARGLAKLSFFSNQAAQQLARGAWQRLSPQRDAALFTHENDLYYCKLDGSGAARLTRTPAAEELATFSPDGKLVAFVQANNLFVVEVATQNVRQLTSDGSKTIFNAKADWVYYEEIFNRDHHAYWWSPDSSHIAFLRFDDGPVRNFTIVDQSVARPDAEITPYPKAGAANPLASLGLVAISGGEPQFVDLSAYTPAASLVVRAGWFPDSQTAYCYVQDRAQTWLDFCTVPATGGEVKCLFRETTKAWVNDPGPPHFLQDGSFLLPSERTGWKHLYRFAADGKLLNAVMSGEWEARTVHTVDEAGGWVYFSGTRDGSLGSNLYRVQLDGSKLERLTTAAGSHATNVSPKGNLFIDAWSDHNTPTQVRLYEADGKLARTLDTNPVPSLAEYRRGKYELVQIPTPDGAKLEASLLLPPNFDPRRKYPVWFMTYGGPHAPTVADSWAGGRVRDEMLAQLGFIVFKADPRSASGKGEAATWTAYRQLGLPELKDVETAIGWLKQKEFVDGERIGMSGHSYGGFLTAFCMTHSKLFAAGIAGAPVTDWRNYDTIYTERYMNTPQENPNGYRNTSVVGAARNLHGKLLIIHGLIDDNVHVQNSLQLIEALQRADKDFEVMFYPKSRHGIGGAHYNRLQVEFMKRALNVTP